MEALLKQIHANHSAALDAMMRDCTGDIVAMATACADALAVEKKLLFCGNGGSACDAMHIAGEFVGRYVDDRRGLPALALSADTGIITAVANDYAYDYIFARQVEALGQAGDVLVALSTSGKSPNVVRAIAAAKERGMTTVLMTGLKAKDLHRVADITIMVPSLITAHVQEGHMVALHAMASLVESRLFPKA